MELCEFRRNVEQIAEYWFAPHEKKMELTDGAQEMANGMLGSAVYGTRWKLEENLINKHRAGLGSVEQAGLRYLWHCIFLPRKNMEVMYPILRRHPALLPACWLVRGGRMVFATPGRSMKNCRTIWRTVQRVKKKEQTEKKNRR